MPFHLVCMMRFCAFFTLDKQGIMGVLMQIALFRCAASGSSVSLAKPKGAVHDHNFLPWRQFRRWDGGCMPSDGYPFRSVIRQAYGKISSSRKPWRSHGPIHGQCTSTRLRGIRKNEPKELRPDKVLDCLISSFL